MRAALAALDARAAAGDPLRLWLRDDDAVRPGPALDRLLALCDRAGIAPLLAVIPAPWDGRPSGVELVGRLAAAPLVELAQHGWSHRNHARAGEKSQELGAHRPAATVLAELAQGRAALRALHGPRLLPLLVPPWNRIAPAVVAGLPRLGFTALSTFGPERPVPGLMAVNARIDIIDWRGGRVGRPAAALWAELAGLARAGAPHVGLLTHHLVHDAAAWAALEALVQGTAGHPGCRWGPVSDLLPPP